MKTIPIFLILLSPVALAACGDGEAGLARDGVLRVVATTGMVADLARNVGGDQVRVEALMGPGIDPHIYKASPRDVDRLRAADVVLYNGRGLEGKMGDILVKLARKKEVVAVTEAIPEEKLLEPEELEGHYDPHVWFDVALWAEAAPVVAAAFGRVLPAHAREFERRATEYRRQLLALHEEIKVELATIPESRRVLLTSHDAFRYFGRAYDLEVFGLQGISTVRDAGVKDVQDMAELIVQRGIKAIFVETSVNPKAIRAVQQAVRNKGREVAIGGELFSDAMGDKPPEDTYLGMVRANVRTIVDALR